MNETGEQGRGKGKKTNGRKEADVSVRPGKVSIRLQGGRVDFYFFTAFPPFFSAFLTIFRRSLTDQIPASRGRRKNKKQNEGEMKKVMGRVEGKWAEEEA